MSLELISQNMLHWFDVNYMQANPSKFQFMFSKKQTETTIEINETKLLSQSCVKLLGVHLDSKLYFNIQCHPRVRNIQEG